MQAWQALTWVSRLLAETVLLKRLMLAVSALLAMAVFLGIVCAVLLCALLYLLWQSLQHAGVGEEVALWLVGGVTLLMLTGLCITIAHRFGALTGMFASRPPGLTVRIGEVSEAFICGLMTPSQRTSDK